jgi:DeoR/GlpR family transcriptional regulator of sugar metabolism
MLPTQRRQAILAEVRQARAVSAEDLARRYGVSLETIRRDLRGLRDRGLLERVYGGALPSCDLPVLSSPAPPANPNPHNLKRKRGCSLGPS